MGHGGGDVGSVAVWFSVVVLEGGGDGGEGVAGAGCIDGAVAG